jgi:L-histidine Nalpha-methyltransferase
VAAPVSPSLAVDVHLGPGDLAASLRRDVCAGLTARPKELPPTWLYDEQGCELFEAITRLPEYYPTRTERAILTERAGAIAALTGADTLVELGSGTSEKTRILLDAMAAAGALRRFVAFDVAEPTLRAAADAISTEYPGVDVHGVVGDFRRHLDTLPAGGRRLVAFLGGTIGNLAPRDRVEFLRRLAREMAPGDALLLGTDLTKDPSRLVTAYDDAGGVTAAFNKNVLTVLNRELAADFDIDRFDHVASFDPVQEWIEMRLRSRGRQRVRIDAVGLTVDFDDGEDLRTEISTKFRLERLQAELAVAGFRLSEWWTDRNDDYAISLSVGAVS